MSTDHTYIIAEAGVNHNGSLDMAKRLVEVAAQTGADAVKFQTFKAERLVSRTAPKAEYQTRTTDAAESQLEMIRKLELDEAAHAALFEHCDKCGIAFLSTPFDEESVALLTGRLQLSRIKIPSGEITNAPLILCIAQTGIPIILSTGMSTLDEIQDALGIIAFGYMGCSGPSLSAFNAAYNTPEGQATLREKVTLLHCTTEYPAPSAEINLKAMDTMREAFGLPVGFSDHSQGITAAIAAVARGAVLVEKHFTLDRTLPGPDHKASLEPEALETMIKAIRDVELMLGTGLKEPSPSERKNMAIARKSLVAACPIASGELFTVENITAKRPGNGVSPMRYWEVTGTAARKAYEKDEQIP